MSTRSSDRTDDGGAAGRRDYVDVILEQWARERPDLDAAPMGTIARVWRLARLSEAATEENFAEHGLSRGGFDVLAALRRSGAPYELSPTELYSSLLISSGAMTNRIDRLEEMGLVERIPHADDRRGIRVVLTERGRRVIDDAVRDHLENERRMLSVLSPEERRVLPALLRKLLLHLGDVAEETPVEGDDAPTADDAPSPLSASGAASRGGPSTRGRGSRRPAR
jgi:DNA-binding MarR family transcriptional regulator